jgi:8-oxo-dGTP pyrophosphatase MutT (NUDIX family)/phosphohistidine phosphatase SixA
VARLAPEAASSLDGGVVSVVDRLPEPDAVEVRAAGGVVRRRGPQGPEIVLVHRPRYDDWTLPKGKANPGESDEASALREVQEETGLRCLLGSEVATVRYRDHLDRSKTVRYWLMHPAGGGFVPNDEVDRVRWMDPSEAISMLTYGHDRDVVRRAIGFDAPLYLLRHAKAGDRRDWTEDDLHRPLTKKGRWQSEALVAQFRDLPLDRVLSSPYDRCTQTVRPLAIARRLPLEETAVLAEGAELAETVAFLHELSGAAVLCSHGDVIPAVVLHLAERGAPMAGREDWKKGSTWVLERDGGLFTGARHLDAPA